jgi:hypothetical protein
MFMAPLERPMIWVMFYADMELHTGRIIQGVIVLDQDDALEEGAAVVVWIGHADRPVRVSDEELDLVRQGKAEAARGELLDARAFLQETRPDSSAVACEP